MRADIYTRLKLLNDSTTLIQNKTCMSVDLKNINFLNRDNRKPNVYLHQNMKWRDKASEELACITLRNMEANQCIRQFWELG